MSGKRVVIVGGGITGLSAAYYLERLAPKASITLLERSAVLGGKIATKRRDGFLIEEGPDCFFTHKPWALDLIKELGIEDRLIAPKQSGFKMLVDGKLWPVARELVPLAYADLSVIDKAEFVSPEGRDRAKQEPLQPARTSTSDESIASFFRRRYGDEFSKKMVEPLLAGTHSAPAAILSMQGLYPNFIRMERENGSLHAAAKAAVANVTRLPEPAPGVHAKPAPAFLSFRSGMGELIHCLRAAMETTEAYTAQMTLPGQQGTLQTESGVIDFDELLIAAGPTAASMMLLENTEALGSLGSLDSTGEAKILTFAFSRDQIGSDLNATGFLTPEHEDTFLKGCTWSSEKWEDRCPSEYCLLRVFLDPSCSSCESLNVGRSVIEEISALLHIDGGPIFSEATAAYDNLPVYQVGYLDHVTALNTALEKTPNIHVAGASYGGVGIPDCIRQGKEAAEKIAANLSG